MSMAPAAKQPVASTQERRAIWSLRLLAALSLVLPAMLFAIAATISNRTHFDDAHARLGRAADLMHEHALKVFDSIQLTGSEVGEIVRDMSDDDIRREEPALHQRFYNLEEALPDVRNITIFDADGKALVSARTFPANALSNASGRQYFKALRAPDSPPFVTDLLTELQNPQFQFFDVTFRRSLPDGTFVGIIAVAAEQKYFQDFYRTVAGEDFDSVSLAKPNGSVLARFPPLPSSEEQPGAASGLTDAIAKSPDSGEYISKSASDNIRRMFAYRRLESLPIYVNVGIDTASIRRSWIKAMAQYLYFGVPATIALFLLILRAIGNARKQYRTLAALRSEAERREVAEGALLQASKMEAIGRLTGGVAHDYNNILQIMVGRLGRVDRAVEKGQPIVPRDLEGLHFAVDRAATLTHRLLAFSRQSPLKVEMVDLNKLVAGMSDLVKQTVGESVSIETVMASGLWKVMVDVNQLENALLNIASNARDAMDGPVKLTIETANSFLDVDYVRRYSDVSSGQYALVSVSDTGTGIPADIISRFSIHFSQPKRRGEGPGSVSAWFTVSFVNPAVMSRSTASQIVVRRSKSICPVTTHRRKRS